MSNFLFPISQASDLCYIGEDKIREMVSVIISNEEEYINISDLNKLIVSKKIKYKFSDINTKYPSVEFCSGRDISNNHLNVIDLFCGAGGSSSGFRLAGFNIVGALDVNIAAAKTHELNFRECKTIVGDITEISPKEFDEMISHKRVDIVIGSPPCQTFSSLSQGKIKSLGKDIRHDIRNYFYKNYLDYISYFRPKIFLMENVPGFMTKYNGDIFKDFLCYVHENLPEYEIKHTILDAKDFSVPQSRKRLFVCGYLKEMNFEFPTENKEFCDKNTFVSVSEALKDLPRITDDWRLDKVPYSSEAINPYLRIMRTEETCVTNNICRVSNDKAKELFIKLKPGQKYVDLSDNVKNEISLFDSFNSSVIMGRCRRLPLDDISWTIIAHIGMDGYEYIHPTECRTLSVREAARLQSFTDDFVFVGNMREQYVQVGNAVPPLLSYALAKQIAYSLNKYKKL
ncbi:DNA cytosine methyltransferase [Clostridium tetani]|uniref:DNA cytosine methyltransferase n=1 Tax=Clostridium tetani TaxID=1513 RepID=UPI001009CE86|nr:DNA cytosine methyltransferase [Clostridium tetani]RXI64431.1 DNA (cytosine-5-)-methyltransferase [Clostridium tetani]RXI68022.1 DNA (cytosine-5-)-methyltransferase [Clostridium tetani]RXM54365.1 DNA (cytosine-5-)-methyltransferase [Clostridium tetani]